MKKHSLGRHQFILSSVAGIAQAYAGVSPGAQMEIAHAPNASALEILAAREIRRYLYLRTGTLLRIVTVSSCLAISADSWSAQRVTRW